MSPVRQLFNTPPSALLSDTVAQAFHESDDLDDDDLPKSPADELAESLLLQVAEQEVELDELREQHRQSRRNLSRIVTATEQAWREAPSWLRTSVCLSLFLGLVLMQ